MQTEHIDPAITLTLKARLQALAAGQANLERRAQHAERERLEALQQRAEALAQAARLQQDFEELQAKYDAVQLEVNVLMERISKLTIELADAKDKDRQLYLSEEIKRLQRALRSQAGELYGSSKSERRGAPEGEATTEPEADATTGPQAEDAQQRLEQEAQQAEKEKKKRKRKKKKPSASQPQLDLKEVHHYLDEPDCDCPRCGHPMKEMGGDASDITELVAVVTRSYVIERHIQHKYRCNQCHHIDTALGVETRLVKGGRYDLTFAVEVALDKYLDHLPLERQARRMGRAGLQVTSQTLWDQLVVLYTLLFPTFKALSERVRTAKLLHADETSWRMMGKKRSKKWWLWLLVGDKGALFELLPSRGNSSAKSILRDYDGLLVADGYGVYRSLEGAESKRAADPQRMLDLNEPALPDYLLAGCWSHARRPFVKAEKNGLDVKEGLDLIGELYAIEALAKERAEGDPEALLEHRRQLREERSREVVAKIKAWRDQLWALPKSGLDKGLTFLNNQWKQLTVFLDHPMVPLDNNRAERNIRGPVLGRKNYQGVRSTQGAQVAAMMFSLFASCEIEEVNPRLWMLEATKRALKTPGAVLLPHEFALEQAAQGS